MQVTRRIILAALVVGLLFSGEALGANKSGVFDHYGEITCGEYLGAYASTTLTGERDFSGDHKFFKAAGWINGYLTAYNQLKKNMIRNVLVQMSVNDARRWMGAWCRDNPSSNLLNAIDRLIKSQPLSIDLPPER